MVAGRDLGRGAPAGLSGGGHGFAPEPATDHSLVLGAERKLQAEGLRRVKAYRVERRAPRSGGPPTSATGRRGRRSSLESSRRTGSC